MPVPYDHYFGGFDLSAHSLFGPIYINVIHFTCRKCETTLCKGLFSTGQLGYGTLFQMVCWKSCSCCQSYYNATVVIAIAKCQRAKILPIRPSLKLPYTTLCYIASRFILPWNFRALLSMLPPSSLASLRGCLLAISDIRMTRRIQARGT